MIATSIGVNLILRPKVRVRLEKNDVYYLPIVVLIEEVIFRLWAFWLLGFITSNPIFLIGASTALFALIHLGNLKETKHTNWDIPKYLLNIGVLGAMLGYVYLQHGFIITFLVHLVYDFIVFALYFLQEWINGGKRK